MEAAKVAADSAAIRAAQARALLGGQWFSIQGSSAHPLLYAPWWRNGKGADLGISIFSGG